MIAASELALPDACGMQISNNYPVSTAGATDFTPCAHLKILPANVKKLETELLKTCLACVQTGRNLSDCSKHRNPSIVDLTSPHLIRVVIKPRQ